MGTGWAGCGCNTIYTDAAGNPINGAGSGSDGSVQAGTCSPNWGLLAVAGVVAIVAASLAGHKA